jgi:hypothetical protein
VNNEINGFGNKLLWMAVRHPLTFESMSEFSGNASKELAVFIID